MFYLTSEPQERDVCRKRGGDITRHNNRSLFSNLGEETKPEINFNKAQAKENLHNFSSILTRKRKASDKCVRGL